MNTTQRYLAAAIMVAAVFFSSYVYAATRSGGRVAPSGVAPGDASATPACACCGGGAAGPLTKGEARLEDGVQRIEVSTASGAWDPGEIALAAGVPAEITFAEGRGCLAEVVFPDLDIRADLTEGGATVKLPGLSAGEYTFTCGMSMVFGKLIVR